MNASTVEKIINEIGKLTNPNDTTGIKFLGHEISVILELGTTLLSKAADTIQINEYVEYTKSIVSSFDTVLTYEAAWDQLDSVRKKIFLISSLFHP